MINFSSKGGYSSQIYNEFIGDTQVRILAGSGPIPVNKFVDNKPTDEVVNIKMEFYFVGLGSQSVKFPSDFNLDSNIKDMSVIKFINPVATRFKNKIYIKADGIEASK